MSVEPITPVGSVSSAAAAVATRNAYVAGAIRKAAQTTGTSFDYLLATAKVESSLNPNLSAKSSSATGLFQFIDQTWLATMKQAGRSNGYERYADAIQRTSSGRYVVSDPALRNEIMQLRKDPTANAVMAGAFTRQNASVLANRIGRAPSEGELYIAHFFGAGGGAKLIKTVANNPQADAASLFPQAARANRPIFYDKQGNARSVSGVYNELVRRYQVARANPMPGTTAVAAATETKPVSATQPARDTAGIANAFAVANVQTSAAVKEPGPVFHTMFQSDGPRDPVAPAIAELWGAKTAQLRAQDAQAAFGPAVSAATASGDRAGSALDLFQVLRPRVRRLFGGGA